MHPPDTPIGSYVELTSEKLFPNANIDIVSFFVGSLHFQGNVNSLPESYALVRVMYVHAGTMCPATVK